MLCICFLQYWSNLLDPGAEQALCESRSICRFIGIDLGREPVPYENMIPNFRHFLGQHALSESLNHVVGEYLQERAAH